MQPLFYDDQPLAPLLTAGPSIFLAGPTAQHIATPWRRAALALLEGRSFTGAVMVPEFREPLFRDSVQRYFGHVASPIPLMHGTSYGILDWETCGIESATVVLFWMPFRISPGENPPSLPGLTTRAEVSRELVRAPDRIVLGMPPDATSGSHIRYHAFRSGVKVHTTLEETVEATLNRVDAHRTK